MAHRFAEIAFTPEIRSIQAKMGSRSGYAAMDTGEDYNHLLGAREADFIGARDSFYMASVSETGWPYVQHRGGPVGFMKVLDERSFGLDYDETTRTELVKMLRDDFGLPDPVVLRERTR